MDIIQFLVDELNNITEPTEEDVIIELPFSVVKQDCYNIINSICGMDLNEHNIIFHLNAENNWVDIPCDIFLSSGDYCTNAEIVQCWHECAHILQDNIKNLEETSPRLWELLPSVFEEICIQFYNLKFEKYRSNQLRQFVAVALIDQELLQNGRENLIPIVEHIQNFCKVNITPEMLSHLEPGSRYVGNYWGYVYCRYLAKLFCNKYNLYG